MAGGTLIPQTVIRPGATWTMAVNRNQNLLGKTMLVLERPCSAVVDLSPAEWAELHAELRELVLALGRCFAPDHVNFAFLRNQAAQVHLHVIPRYQSERIWNGFCETTSPGLRRCKTKVGPQPASQGRRSGLVVFQLPHAAG